jgi:hypothetical protein
MDIERLRELRLAHPFRPFYLVMSDGRRLPVDEPYYLGISPTKRFAVHSSEGGGYEVVRPNQVSDVEFGDVRRNTSSANNGGKGGLQ